MIKGTKWTVFGNHSTWYWKGSIVSTGNQNPWVDPWISRRTLCRWAIWLAEEWASNTLFTNQPSVCNCHKMTNLWTIANKIKCTNSSNFNITYHRCLLDKHVTRMLQQEGNLSVLKIFFRRKMSWKFVMSCYYCWKSTKFVVAKNSHILLCMSRCYTCEKIIYIDRFNRFVKTLQSDKKSLRSENSKLD